MYLLANKADRDQAASIEEHAEQMDLKVIGVIPFDSSLEKFNLEGLPLLNLPDSSVAIRNLEAIAKKIRP